MHGNVLKLVFLGHLYFQHRLYDMLTHKHIYVFMYIIRLNWIDNQYVFNTYM